MANLNKVQLIGNLTRDPEIRHTPKGTAVAEISLAINRQWRDEGGNKQEEVTFVDVTLWGRTAEIAQAHLSKGSAIYLEGRLNLDSWEDKTTGQKRQRLKVIGENFQFLGSKPSSDARQQSSTQREPAHQSATDDSLDQGADDDLPF